MYKKRFEMGFKIYKDGRFRVFSAAVLTVMGTAGVVEVNNQVVANAQENVQGDQLDKTEEVMVTADTFEEYFNVNGHASYDKETGIATLTPFE